MYFSLLVVFAHSCLNRQYPYFCFLARPLSEKKKELDAMLSDLEKDKSEITYSIKVKDDEDEYVTEQKTERIKKIVTSFYLNTKSAAELSSKPEDVLIKPPSKTQMFGNPCAETNIALMKGSTPVEGEQVKTDAKYLYSMQVYMFQNEIYLLDYAKLKNPKYNTTPDVIPKIDKRSMFWGNYFKSVDDDEDKKGVKHPGFYSNLFPIKTDIKLTEAHTYNEKTFAELKKSYTGEIQTYRLRNYQPKEDSPIVSHLNYILA